MLNVYKKYLAATYEWIMRSIANGRGGSCAYYRPLSGWSEPYPETTGYLVPTVLAAGQTLNRLDAPKVAVELGDWLLSLQQGEGWWPGGLYSRRRTDLAPSVFNTAQILDGMVALYRTTGGSSWLDALERASTWLAAGVDEGGRWTLGNYRNAFNPSYYTQVAWPMLEAWSITKKTEVRNAAERVLELVLTRRRSNGAFNCWGFAPGQPAFTHTIAYTLRGLLESARILGAWERFGQPALLALETIQRRCELAGGRLAAAFDENWRQTSWYSCLTGNAQIALCLLHLERKETDLRLVNTAAKLVDSVCKTQRIDLPASPINGAVAGSNPFWGRYMTLRYPNWAAKYHCDALCTLMYRLRQEGLH